MQKQSYVLNSTSRGISINLEESVNHKKRYTYELDINEPSSLNSVPIFRILNNTGEIVSKCNAITVSLIFKKEFELERGNIVHPNFFKTY